MEQGRRTARGTALVVSNAPDVAGSLVGPLRAADIEVLRTARCIEALALAAVVAPELVLVDARLPGAGTLGAELADAGRAGQALLVLVREGEQVDVPPGCEVVDFDSGACERVLLRAETLVAEGRDLRAASPLTGLPGNAAIRLELERRVAAGTPVALIYVDIDGFKPFNDRYGFLRGDDVLRALAAIVDREASRRPGTFVGHVGGDDFVVLAAPEDAEAIAAAVVAAFDAAVPGLYDAEDAGRGYIEAENRQGLPVRWPLMSISVGIATNVHHEVVDPLALVDLATEMKHVAKHRAGSAVALDRRASQAGRVRRRVPVRAWTRRAAAAVAAAALLALPGVGVAAAGAAPGDRMWPAARLLEDARLAVAGDDRAALHGELAGARLTDLVAALTARDEDRLALAAFEFAHHVDAASRDPGLAEQLHQHALVLERLQASACGDEPAHVPACGAVTIALRAADAASQRSRQPAPATEGTARGLPEGPPAVPGAGAAPGQGADGDDGEAYGLSGLVPGLTPGVRARGNGPGRGGDGAGSRGDAPGRATPGGSADAPGRGGDKPAGGAKRPAHGGDPSDGTPDAPPPRQQGNGDAGGAEPASGGGSSGQSTPGGGSAGGSGAGGGTAPSSGGTSTDADGGSGGSGGGASGGGGSGGGGSGGGSGGSGGGASGGGGAGGGRDR